MGVYNGIVFKSIVLGLDFSYTAGRGENVVPPNLAVVLFCDTKKTGGPLLNPYPRKSNTSLLKILVLRDNDIH